MNLMPGFFYHLGKKLGPRVRQARWAWASATAPEPERLEAERLVGAEMAAAVKQQKPACLDPAAADTLRQIGAALAQCLTNPHRRFAFDALGGDTPEAFCLPGGFVFVSLPMIRLCRDDRSRLAFVLAHEMAHVVKGHVLERIVTSAVIGRAAQLAPIATAAGQAVRQLGTDFLQKAYSRAQENEADAFGLQLMTAARFEPSGALTVLEALAAAEEPDALGQYFSTHPDTRDRIAALKARIESLS